MVEPWIIGTIASTLTTSAFFPQVLKVMRSRKTKDISLAMYCVFTAGVSLWLVYGLMIDSWPIIIGNMVTLLCAAYILWMKLRLG